MAESEFGKGLVVCLVKFAEHKERYSERLGDGGMSSSKVELLFNGASDHLYEIEVPEQWKGTEIEAKVTELKDFGLMIGHGFKGRVHTKADITRAYSLCRDIALLIDKKLGLNAEIGEW